MHGDGLGAAGAQGKAAPGVGDLTSIGNGRVRRQGGRSVDAGETQGAGIVGFLVAKGVFCSHDHRRRKRYATDDAGGQTRHVELGQSGG